MNALSNQANVPITAPESEEVSVDTIRARRRRRILVNSIRVLILVVFIGGWQFLTTVGIIDPFFWGQPSGIWNSARHLGDAGHGTGTVVAANRRDARRGYHRFRDRRVLRGHLWRGAWTELLPGRRAEPLHQSSQCDPTRHARAPVRDRAGPGDPIQDRAVSSAGLLHCVF